MRAKQIADIIAASVRATLVQVAGVDPAEIANIAKAIANNAAQALSFELASDE